MAVGLIDVPHPPGTLFTQPVADIFSAFNEIAFPGADKAKTDFYPAGTRALQLYDSAVSSYFLYAHALSVLHRVVELGQEMESLIEVMTGAPPTPELAATFRFPD